MRHRRLRLLPSCFGLCAAVGVLLAQESSAPADVLCGSTSAGWNVPNGDAVFEESPGVIQGVLASVGEYRTHSMLSRGPGGWMTHATSITPPVNNDRNFLGSECNAPISQNFLYAATPGLETVSQGAAYAFLYKAGPINFIGYQSGQMGAPGGSNTAIGNTFLGAGMSWVDWYSTQDSSQVVFAEAYNGTQIHYGWYQYMNVQGAAHGVPGVNTGVVCSTSLALWQHDALSNTSGYSGDVLPRSYPGTIIGPAATALYNGVYSECSQQTGGMFSSFGAFLQNLGTCSLCLNCNICNVAANQMVNCFANNDCGSSRASEWQGIAANGTAVSISPDDIACWNRPNNGSGAPCTGKGSSVWGWDVSETVQWNSGGNSYSCWN